MRVDERLLSCVAFIGRDDSGSFTPYGTGFWAVARTGDKLFQHLVTARHVIELLGDTDPICVRANTLGGRIEHLYLDRDAWVFHPDQAVDVAVSPSRAAPEKFSIVHIDMDAGVATPEIFKEKNLGIGEDVFMAGLFTRHLGDTANSPIVRIGTLAGMPKDKVQTNRGLVHAFLVEARSIAGLSGSPVFLQPAPLRILPGGEAAWLRGASYYFLGLMQGHFVTQDPTEVASPDEEYSPGDMTTGIGVVVPAQRIIEVINLPVLVEQREAILRDMKKKSGFVEDAAVPKAPKADENPRHKEDFTRLLDAATRGKKPTDQT